MSYTPTEWKTGDVITAPKLNNIEQGIVNAGKQLVIEVNGSSDSLTANKTIEDINQFVKETGSYNMVLSWNQGPAHIFYSLSQVVTDSEDVPNVTSADFYLANIGANGVYVDFISIDSSGVSYSFKGYPE